MRPRDVHRGNHEFLPAVDMGSAAAGKNIRVYRLSARERTKHGAEWRGHCRIGDDMAGRKPAQDRPTLEPASALRALKTQLAALDALKGRNSSEAEDDEGEWEQLTQSIIERAFCKESTNVSKFHSARFAGSHAIREYRDVAQEQINYDKRQRAFAVLLRGLIAELRLLVPADEIRGVYHGGDAYGFYRDISTLVVAGTCEVFIVDAYLDESVFNLYVDKIVAGTSVRMLTGKSAKNVAAVAALYAKGKPLQLRLSTEIHDRVIFIDGRGWLVGQSFKDAAQTKPTTMIELSALLLPAFRAAHETIWNTATVIV